MKTAKASIIPSSSGVPFNCGLLKSMRLKMENTSIKVLEAQGWAS
jgi:hypothetical protein